MKCEMCGIDFPDNDSSEAKHYGEYLFNGMCLHCWTKSNKLEHDQTFSSCPECNELFEESK
jgi:hypothetical protein